MNKNIADSATIDIIVHGHVPLLSYIAAEVAMEEELIAKTKQKGGDKKCEKK